MQVQQALWWCETLYLHVHWYVAVCCKCKRACAFLHVPLEAGVVPVYCGQYIRGNVQGRLAARACNFEKEEWQKTGVEIYSCSWRHLNYIRVTSIILLSGRYSKGLAHFFLSNE